MNTAAVFALRVIDSSFGIFLFSENTEKWQSYTVHAESDFSRFPRLRRVFFFPFLRRKHGSFPKKARKRVQKTFFALAKRALTHYIMYHATAGIRVRQEGRQ
jgi:hypothetical protein